MECGGTTPLWLNLAGYEVHPSCGRLAAGPTQSQWRSPPLRFGEYFGTPPEHWLKLQHMHDLANARGEHADALKLILR